ncbi:MAG TPA: Rieske 2Fe-2S domain-containing protein, partial [Chitinophagaceae bacterium]|nr:Rieske 2Fe-2S domain-containing protein [Chitinophagaceae bacterium]
MQRREFLKASCNICVLGAAGFARPRLTGCSPAASLAVYKTTIVNKQLQVPLNLFDKSPLQIIRPAGWYYDVAVEKKEDNTYRALLMQCTHQENQLTVTGNGFNCSLHGSQFD